MKKLLTVFAMFCFIYMHAQLTVTPSGGNKKATVGERIGLTDVVIHYDRPGVKGREGKIWGQLVQAGYNDLGFGNTKQAPWRAGANENTTIEFSTDVQVEGQPLAAGKYAFFIAYDPNECTLIFSKNSNSWGSFFYNPAEDALRVKVKPASTDKSVEWLKYEFTDEKPASATVALQWEKLVIPFTITVDLPATQIAMFRKELQTDRGFLWESWAQAAQWCVDNNTNLTQALVWSDTAVSVNFGGDRSFQAWSTKAQVLDKLGRGDEATAIMKKALPYGNQFEVHQYAKDLMTAKKYQQAFAVFKMNYDAHPTEFVTTAGMARAYSALGNYTEALKYAQAALPLAQPGASKAAIEKAIETLKQGKDFN
jgi:tetratricopeptide (TPR) repeat protein